MSSDSSSAPCAKHTDLAGNARHDAVVPARDLAEHSTLTMTLRYMHLAPSALREAIGLLDDFGQPVGNAEKAAS